MSRRYSVTLTGAQRDAVLAVLRPIVLSPEDYDASTARRAADAYRKIEGSRARTMEKVMNIKVGDEVMMETGPKDRFVGRVTAASLKRIVASSNGEERTVVWRGGSWRYPKNGEVVNVFRRPAS